MNSNELNTREFENIVLNVIGLLGHIDDVIMGSLRNNNKTCQNKDHNTVQKYKRPFTARYAKLQICFFQ